MTGKDIASVADEFEWFADWADSVAPLYERLASEAASDERLLEIAAEGQAGQPAPNLLFGAVHSLLLDGMDHRLASYYPTCRETPREPDCGLFPTFREFVLANEPQVRDVVRSRRVQTNAVGRSVVLFPAFRHLVETTASQPLALVEIGSSAGLNLYWDQYQYDYGGYGAYGNPDSSVRIGTDVRGGTDPPLGDDVPEVAHRVGIDINTLDVTDAADAQWLRALVMPDQQLRFDRLDAAIGMVREDPPRLVDGDALDVLPKVLAEIPLEYDVCVFSTVVLYQFEDADIAALRELLHEASDQRTVHWLSDDPGEAMTPPTLRYATFEDGIETRQLAQYKAHGEWVRWLAEE